MSNREMLRVGYRGERSETDFHHYTAEIVVLVVVLWVDFEAVDRGFSVPTGVCQSLSVSSLAKFACYTLSSCT